MNETGFQGSLLFDRGIEDQRGDTRSHSEVGEADHAPDSASDLGVGLAWMARGPVSLEECVSLSSDPWGCPPGAGKGAL